MTDRYIHPETSASERIDQLVSRYPDMARHADWLKEVLGVADLPRPFVSFDDIRRVYSGMGIEHRVQYTNRSYRPYSDYDAWPDGSRTRDGINLDDVESWRYLKDAIVEP